MQKLTVILALFVALIIPLSAHAVSVDEVSNPRHVNAWVSDEADMLSRAAQERIDARIDTLEQETGVEIAVVTVPSVNAATPRDFGTQLFNHWGIGKAGEDNGLLVLMVEDERRLETETGYGLEAELTDSWLKTMQESTMVPHFRRGNFDRGLEAGVEAVIERLAPALAQDLSEDSDPLDSLPADFDRPGVPDIDVRTYSTSPPSSGCSLEDPFVFYFLFGIALVIAIFAGFRRLTCPKCDIKLVRDRNAPGDTASSHVYVCSCGFKRTINVSSNSGGSFGSSGGSFGGGGGGGSFGGGSSGGGGAGSSW